jgi:hypothetical protein
MSATLRNGEACGTTSALLTATTRVMGAKSRSGS